MRNLLAHFFIPRPSNSHRSFALHFKSVFGYIFLLACFQLLLGYGNSVRGVVLSYASNISVPDLLKYTNQKRVENHVGTLVLNDKLSSAALRKSENMFAEQYWAHTSPKGEDPWGFITSSGYNYLYAGENLARDFADSAGVVNAWMNSPSHRENLVNNRYRDVGFAVVNGKYGNYETTLVVQMFGALAAGAPTVSAPSWPQGLPAIPGPVSAQVLPVTTSLPGQTGAVELNAFSITRNLSLLAAIFLGIMLVTDAVIVRRRQIIRIAGHNSAHLVFIASLAIAMFVIARGMIL